MPLVAFVIEPKSYSVPATKFLEVKSFATVYISEILSLRSLATV